MRRNSLLVFSAWAWLVAVAILFPPWTHTLSTPWGGVREYTIGAPIFTRPVTSRSDRPWHVHLLLIEVSLIAGAALITHRMTPGMSRSADRGTARGSVPSPATGETSRAHSPSISSDGELTKHRLRLLAFLAVGLYACAQVNPAIHARWNLLLGVP
jgi:hypothetical protein